MQVKFAMLALGWFGAPVCVGSLCVASLFTLCCAPGVVQLLLLWPGFFVVDALKVELFELPRGRALASLLVTAAMVGWRSHAVPSQI